MSQVARLGVRRRRCLVALKREMAALRARDEDERTPLSAIRAESVEKPDGGTWTHSLETYEPTAAIYPPNVACERRAGQRPRPSARDDGWAEPKRSPRPRGQSGQPHVARGRRGSEREDALASRGLRYGSRSSPARTETLAAASSATRSIASETSGRLAALTADGVARSPRSAVSRRLESALLAGASSARVPQEEPVERRWRSC